ncbi:MAG: hypothetical protein WBA05_14110 [Gordonia sp. (in: high G+C Gram-positive bacteria)]|uniref:hypothetical protein n=1 Tax=Gordonia sp. (in: high G+C Gram-positive bacteria) TaxID=84139 RepID=UPI003C731638
MKLPHADYKPRAHAQAHRLIVAQIEGDQQLADQIDREVGEDSLAQHLLLTYLASRAWSAVLTGFDVSTEDPEADWPIEAVEWVEHERDRHMEGPARDALRLVRLLVEAETQPQAELLLSQIEDWRPVATALAQMIVYYESLPEQVALQRKREQLLIESLGAIDQILLGK